MPPPALRSAGIGHVFLDDPRIAVAQHHGAARVAHELGRAFDHAVTLALGLNLYLARAGHLEALLGAALGLQLGHFALLLRRRLSLPRLDADREAAARCRQQQNPPRQGPAGRLRALLIIRSVGACNASCTLRARSSAEAGPANPKLAYPPIGAGNARTL